MMKVPLLDLKSQYQSIKDEILETTQEVFESQGFILGPRVVQLEDEIARYCQTSYAVGVSSGTDALLIALMACGVGPGHSVVTTPYTFFATAGAIVRVGAKPVFVDIDPESYNLSAAGVEQIFQRMSTSQLQKTRAILPVHLYGQCADMQPLQEIASKHGCVIIEDAAQAIGAEYQGKRAGSLGDLGCFSFFPSKNLGAFGDGGMVTATSEEMYEKLKILRMHGASPKYYHQIIGGNFRLDALQAAIVSVKLKHLEKWTQARRQNAQTYRELFANAGLNEVITLPRETADRHVYNQFVIKVAGKRRDALKQYMMDAGIGTEIYYPVPLHLQECFKHLNYQAGDFPVAEEAAARTLALPVYPELTTSQQAYVVDRMASFFQNL
jgi:dTDP-4-amino-4,6-dideoxygalactose transaminase